MEEIVRNLRSVAEQYKNAFTSTGSVRIADMATDCANHIEKLETDLDRYRIAEQEGRLVELPCKVGDMVWRVLWHCTESDLDDCIECPRNESGRCKPKFFEQSFSIGLYDEIGKTVFLTRAEAEAAKEGKG